jgi:hypothetical protein
MRKATNGVLIALACAGTALASASAAAQTTKDSEDLRQELARLREQIEQLDLKARDAAVKGDIDGGLRLPGSETSLHIYGFAEAHLIHDFGATAPGDTFGNLPEQPLSGSGASKGATKLTAQSSRFGFETVTPTQHGTFNTKLEMDFYAYCGSECNRNRLRLRHAYGEYAGWLIGQTWSTFMDLDNTAETIDFNAQIGVPFSRRTQIRYTWGDPRAGYKVAFALEDPTDQFGGGSSNERVPHLVARFDKTFDWGGMNLRALTHEKRDPSGAHKRGYGVGMGGSFKVTDKDVLMATLARVDGDFDNMIGSNLYRFDGTKFLFDRNVGFALGWACTVNDKLRTNVSYEESRAHVSDEFLALGDANRRLRQLHADFIYSPIKNVELGAELVAGKRSTYLSGDGTLTRLDLMGRYSF